MAKLDRMKKSILPFLLLLPLAQAQTEPTKTETTTTAEAQNPNFKVLEPLSKERLLKFTAPEWVIHPAQQYRAILSTTKGEITVEFFPKVAPKTVNSFVFLALNHYYDGVPFHRVLDGFMAQTGDPTGTGTGGPGYGFMSEFEKGLEFTQPGLLAMANSGSIFSNGSQFFITFAKTDWLNYQHTIFGKVIYGMDVVNKLQRIDPSKPDAKIKPDVINTVTILQGE